MQWVNVNILRLASDAPNVGMVGRSTIAAKNAVIGLRATTGDAMRVFVDDVNICEKEKPLVDDKPYSARVAFKRRAVREFEFWLTVAILCSIMLLGWFFAAGVLYG